VSRHAAGFEVGFEEMDAQHGHIFDRMEALTAALHADDGAAARAAIVALRDSLATHFAFEESVMEAAKYPERGRHKAAHDLFMQDFAQLTRDMEATGLSVPVIETFTSRIPEWVKFHIQVNDAPLGRFLAGARSRPGAEPRPEKNRGR